MAHRSTRAGSRQTTPQTVAEPVMVAASKVSPKRTTRTTRSQSREINESEKGKNGSKPRRGTRQPTLEEAASADQGGSKGQKVERAHDVRIRQDLSTVQEDSTISNPDIQLVEDDFGQGKKPSPPIQNIVTQPSKSPRRISAFSGTTARTSLTNGEPTDLSPENLSDALPDLVDASDRILNLLLPSELSEDNIANMIAQLQMKDSRRRKNFSRLANTFQLQWDVYGSAPYISPSRTLGLLIGVRPPLEVENGPWRPEPLFYKANLASLARSLLSSLWNDADGFVEGLDQSFPMAFLESVGDANEDMPGHSTLFSETLKLALDIRTQLAVWLLARHAGQQNFDFDIILHRVFYKDKRNLNGWDIEGMRLIDFNHEARNIIISRLGDLRKAFTASALTTPESHVAGVERLQETYSLTKFIHKTIVWISHRLHEVDSQIATSSGVEGICKGLENEIKSRRLATSSSNADYDQTPLVALEYEPPLPASGASHISSGQEISPKKWNKTEVLKLGAFSASSPKARSAAKELKKLEVSKGVAKTVEQEFAMRNQQHGGEIQVTATAGPSRQALTHSQKVTEPIIPSSAPVMILQGNEHRPPPDETSQLQPAILVQANRALTSHRTDPDRANPDEVLALRDRREAESNKENQQPSAVVKRYNQAHPSAHRYTWDSQDVAPDSHPIEDDDVSSDQGFQTQIVPADAPPRRTAKPVRKRQTPQPVRSQAQSPKRARLQGIQRPENDNSLQDNREDSPLPTQLENYAEANSQAKARTAMIPKPLQTRKPWSEEETETLLVLITNYGTSWQRLKDEDLACDYVLKERDAGALKDKARNMKMDFLKTGRVLPTNFDRIKISQIQIKRLTDLNIEYSTELGTRTDAIL